MSIMDKHTQLGKLLDDNTNIVYISLIKNNFLDPNPSGTYCCNEGRPIRSKEMRNVFTDELNLTRSNNSPGVNCYIYCEKSGQGHVYYGTKSNCVHGTGSADDYGMTYVEYYT